jgi:transposase
MGHDNERRQPRPRRKFSDEFKRDAVDLVLTTGRPIAEVAAELGIYDSTLGNWVRRHQDEQADGTASAPTSGPG